MRERIGGLKYAIGKATQEQSSAEAKARAEQEQREAPKILLRQLKAQYDGASYSFLQCSYAGQSQCFKEAGVFPCGCNEAERHGQYWYDGDIFHSISFPEDGTILISYMWLNKRYSALRGTPKGATIKDIVWEQPEGYTGWRPVWIALKDGLNRITYSKDRPIDNALYSPSQRYSYQLLKKQ